MRKQPRHNTRPHDRLPSSFLGMDRQTSHLNIALIRKIRGSLMCLAYFLTCYPREFGQPGTGRHLVGRLAHEFIDCTACLREKNDSTQVVRFLITNIFWILKSYNSKHGVPRKTFKFQSKKFLQGVNLGSIACPRDTCGGCTKRYNYQAESFLNLFPQKKY